MSNKHVVANVQSYAMLDGNVASVVAATHNVETAQDYANKVKSLFGGKLEIVPHTVRKCSINEHAKAVAFHVRALVESRPFDDNHGMREVITANVFADADDATWQVVETGGIKRLVKRTDTDVGALLAAASKLNVQRIAASNYDAGIGTVHAGEFAIFTNPETASVDSGVVLYGDDGKLSVLSRASGKLIPCGHDAIVAHSAFEMEHEDGDATVEHAFDLSDVQGFLSYFRGLYASAPSFFAQLEAMVRKRFLLG